MSRASQLLTGLAGLVLVAAALVLLGYAIGGNRHLSDLGWIVVVAFPALGGLMLRRSITWKGPRQCPRFGAGLSRADIVCPSCGLDREKTTWAAIGKFKLP